MNGDEPSNFLNDLCSPSELGNNLLIGESGKSRM